jgi:glycosyltransferase involved in cell wall biosynthesis
MRKLRIVNLLDDFSMGGVTNALRIFDAPELREIGDFETIAFDPGAWIAPHLDADIIITHSPPSWLRILWFHSLRRRNPKAKLIHVEHSYSRDWAALHVPDFARFRTMMQFALRPMDEVVVVSKASESWIRQERMVKSEKLHMIHPHSNVPGLNDVPDLVIRRNEPIVVGAYGRFCEAKGFDRLIDAFKETGIHDNLRLVLGGIGPDDAMLRKRAAGCDRISFVGEVTDVAGFLGQCDVIAVPSRFEAYGLVANEAREAGRPIVVSKAGGLPEQVGGSGIVVDCDDPDQLLAALQSLRTLPLRAMGDAGRRSTIWCRADRIRQWSRLLRKVKPSTGGQRVSCIASFG